MVKLIHNKKCSHVDPYEKLIHRISLLMNNFFNLIKWFRISTFIK